MRERGRRGGALKRGSLPRDERRLVWPAKTSQESAEIKSSFSSSIVELGVTDNIAVRATLGLRILDLPCSDISNERN